MRKCACAGQLWPTSFPCNCRRDFRKFTDIFARLTSSGENGAPDPSCSDARSYGSSQITGEIDIFIDQEFQQQLPERWLREAVCAALDVADHGVGACEVSLAVTGDETVRELNRDYRGLDEVTDVLSFSPLHSGRWEGEAPEDREGLGVSAETDFVYPSGELAPLGDVVISFPQVQRQALEHREPLDREMALLIVHGILHLAGHDHSEPVEETKMKSKERAALKMIPKLEMPQSISHLKHYRQPRTVRK